LEFLWRITLGITLEVPLADYFSGITPGVPPADYSWSSTGGLSLGLLWEFLWLRVLLADYP